MFSKGRKKNIFFVIVSALRQWQPKIERSWVENNLPYIPDFFIWIPVGSIFPGTSAGKQKYFFNHISIAEKTITGKQATNWSFQRQGFFLRNNAPARELDVCRPSVFTKLFFIQTYKSFLYWYYTVSERATRSKAPEDAKAQKCVYMRCHSL